jgi:hypothetical protein
MSSQNRLGAHLDNIFLALLRLHKALLDDERVSYERVHGRIPSNGAFLQLVLEDAWFAWLRPLSQVMAKFDELGEEDKSPEGTGFGRHYYEALQREPDVVLAHAAVRTLLR